MRRVARAHVDCLSQKSCSPTSHSLPPSCASTPHLTSPHRPGPASLILGSFLINILVDAVDFFDPSVISKMFISEPVPSSCPCQSFSPTGGPPRFASSWKRGRRPQSRDHAVRLLEPTPTGSFPKQVTHSSPDDDTAAPLPTAGRDAVSPLATAAAQPDLPPTGLPRQVYVRGNTVHHLCTIPHPLPANLLSFCVHPGNIPSLKSAYLVPAVCLRSTRPTA